MLLRRWRLGELNDPRHAAATPAHAALERAREREHRMDRRDGYTAGYTQAATDLLLDPDAAEGYLYGRRYLLRVEWPDGPLPETFRARLARRRAHNADGGGAA